MTTMTPRRKRIREATKAEILDYARGQVSETGECSLREIARGMELTAPALYRYFPSIGAIEDIIAREIALAAALDIDGGGWPAYVAWTADNPMLFAFLAKHPALLAQLHFAVQAALAGAA